MISSFSVTGVSFLLARCVRLYNHQSRDTAFFFLVRLAIGPSGTAFAFAFGSGFGVGTALGMAHLNTVPLATSGAHHSVGPALRYWRSLASPLPIRARSECGGSPWSRPAGHRSQMHRASTLRRKASWLHQGVQTARHCAIPPRATLDAQVKPHPSQPPLQPAERMRVSRLEKPR